LNFFRLSGLALLLQLLEPPFRRFPPLIDLIKPMLGNPLFTRLRLLLAAISLLRNIFRFVGLFRLSSRLLRLRLRFLGLRLFGFRLRFRLGLLARLLGFAATAEIATEIVTAGVVQVLVVIRTRAHHRIQILTTVC
jgi:hypothetical protein